jgi:serine/threonine protein phosphatase 1
MTSNEDFQGEGASDIAPVRVITERPSRLFAVGDIHGCADELQALLRQLIEKESLSSSDQVVFLGDYVDRGPATKDVIAQLLDFKGCYPKTVFLRGNHEDMLLDYLGFGGRLAESCLINGGEETFDSYQVNPLQPISDVVSKMPASHIEFLCNLELAVSLAEFLFVHAGINPFNSLDKQLVRDLMWIRREFTTFEHSLGKTVVFGHTPFEDVFLHLPFKIGIDTGLVYGNKLSAVELVHGTLYQVDRGNSSIHQSSLRQRLDSRPK